MILKRRIRRAFVLVAMEHNEGICLLPSSDAIFLIVGVKVNHPAVPRAIGAMLPSMHRSANKKAEGLMPLRQMKEKQFLSRLMIERVGLSFLRYKPGEGASYVHRHKVQEEVFIALERSTILDGKRIFMPEGTIIRAAPEKALASTM
jgi:hypothetical protein